MSERDPARYGTVRALRAKVIDSAQHGIRIAKFSGSAQERDLSSPTNCGGLGRLHHFSETPTEAWVSDPLPILPAAKALRLDADAVRIAQVFHVAACNLACWYFFVPDDMLRAAPRFSEFTTPRHVLEQFAQLPDRPKVLDLSGGNPGLTPEWVLWTVRELRALGLEQEVYLWSDDNLTVNLYPSVLAPAEIEEIRTYSNYGSVGCFKGFDGASFAFNTGAAPELFDVQFAVFESLMAYGWDLYGYVTLTSPPSDQVGASVERFFERLRAIDENLPLRVVPLEIKSFSPTQRRMNPLRESALAVQYQALSVWLRKLDEQYPGPLRKLPICSVIWASRSAP